MFLEFLSGSWHKIENTKDIVDQGGTECGSTEDILGQGWTDYGSKKTKDILRTELSGCGDTKILRTPNTQGECPSYDRGIGRTLFTVVTCRDGTIRFIGEWSPSYPAIIRRPLSQCKVRVEQVVAVLEIVWSLA